MHILNAEYDVFVCGSDQIWSVLDKNFDGYYYLDFSTNKKISYATSIGANTIPENKAEQIAEWLKSFHAISVREKKTSEQLSDITGKKIQWVCDPTLLHDKNFWDNFCVRINDKPKKYLLCYLLSNKSWYFQYAHHLAKHLKLKLVLIPSCTDYTKYKECHKNGVGPREFVSLIKDAEFILTDSYHGSIFSLLFQKEFLCLKRFDDDDPINQNIRVDSLFEKCDLMDHIVPEGIFSPEDIKSTDYKKINDLLERFRIESRNYLYQNLS